MDPAGIEAVTFLAQSARLARIVPRTILHSGIFLFLAMAIVVFVFLWCTTVGYRVRATGLNPHALRYAGIRVSFHQALSLSLAGGFAGMVGAVEVMGVHYRLIEGFTSGYGFTGIVAALLGWLHPLGLYTGVDLLRGLLVGADTMQRAVQVPSALVNVILGLVVLFVSGSAVWTGRWIRRMRSRTGVAT